MKKDRFKMGRFQITDVQIIKIKSPEDLKSPGLFI